MGFFLISPIRLTTAATKHPKQLANFLANHMYEVTVAKSTATTFVGEAAAVLVDPVASDEDLSKVMFFRSGGEEQSDQVTRLIKIAEQHARAIETKVKKTTDKLAEDMNNPGAVSAFGFGPGVSSIAGSEIQDPEHPGARWWLASCTHNNRRAGPLHMPLTGLGAALVVTEGEFWIAGWPVEPFLESGFTMATMDKFLAGDDGSAFLQEHGWVVHMVPGQLLIVPTGVVTSATFFTHVADKNNASIAHVMTVPLVTQASIAGLKDMTKSALREWHEEAFQKKTDSDMWNKRSEYFARVLPAVQ